MSEVTGLPRIGDRAPDFMAVTTHIPEFNFSAWQEQDWVVMFSHPADFTPVCTTELLEFARQHEKFSERRVKLVGLSVDSVHAHLAWLQNMKQKMGVTISFPLIADIDMKVSQLYGMIHPNANDTLTVRSVFVIGPDKKVKLTLTYPASTGRNFDEILRVIDSLQLTANHQVATPANWKDGEECVIVPAVSDADAKAKFPKGWKALRPYLRLTPQPNK